MVNSIIADWRNRVIEHEERMNKEMVKETKSIKQKEVVNAPDKEESFELWSFLHEEVQRVSMKLFLDGHFKEAAYAAYVELIDRIKEINNEKTNNIMDGTPLMMSVFNQDKPIIQVVGDDVKDWKGIQEGYKYIFAGVTLAVRNPKAHANFKIEKIDALELLLLCSRLFRKIDQAIIK